LLYKFKFQSMFCYTNLRYRLGNDLYCVEWGVKLYSNQLRYRPIVILYCNVRCVHQFLPARIYASAILSMACVCLKPVLYNKTNQSINQSIKVFIVA